MHTSMFKRLMSSLKNVANSAGMDECVEIVRVWCVQRCRAMDAGACVVVTQDSNWFRVCVMTLPQH